jgi:hypothetical protein
MLKVSIALVLALAGSGLAYADCTYQGSTYPEGARIGPFTCQNGAWVKR